MYSTSQILTFQEEPVTRVGSGIFSPGTIRASKKKIRPTPNAIGVRQFVTSAVTNRRRFPRTLADRDVNFEKEARERCL